MKVGDTNIKYIYVVYQNIKGEYHSERCKVIYHNSQCIYYIQTGDKNLHSLYTYNLRDRLTVDSLPGYGSRVYYLERPDDNILRTVSKTKKVKDLVASLSLKKSQYNRAKMDMERLASQISEIEGELNRYPEELLAKLY